MAIFEIEAPDGQIYEVDAPDEASALQAFQGFKGGDGAVGDVGAPSPWANALELATDVAASGASGVGRGIAGLVGLPGMASDAFNDAATWGLSRGYEAIAGEQAPEGSFFSRDQLPRSPLNVQGAQEGLSSLTGGASDYQPQTTAGRYASTAGEFLPGAAVFGGMSPANLTRFGLLPGVASEAAGQMVEGSSYEPYARVGAALLAPALPALASKVISPFGGAISADRQAVINSLQERGITPTAGQATGSKRLLATESELAGQLGTQANEQFTRAALKSAGIDASKATPEVISSGYKALGNQFDDLASRSSTPFTVDTQNKLLNIATDYIEDTPQVAPIVENAVNRIAELASKGKGVLSGESYQKMRSYLGSKANSASDLSIKSSLRDIQSVLDDAVEAGLSGADKSAWQEVRKQYRNFLTLERATTMAGAEAASGILSPAQLRSSVINTQGRRAYSQATGELQDLARSAEQIMTQLPNSGTALRLDARTMGGFGAAGGGGAGALIGGAPGAMAGAAAGVAAPYVAGAALSSRPVQSYLANQIAPNMSAIDPRTLSVIQGLLSNNQGSN